MIIIQNGVFSCWEKERTLLGRGIAIVAVDLHKKPDTRPTDRDFHRFALQVLSSPWLDRSHRMDIR